MLPIQCIKNEEENSGLLGTVCFGEVRKDRYPSNTANIKKCRHCLDSCLRHQEQVEFSTPCVPHQQEVAWLIEQQCFPLTGA